MIDDLYGGRLGKEIHLHYSSMFFARTTITCFFLDSSYQQKREDIAGNWHHDLGNWHRDFCQTPKHGCIQEKAFSLRFVQIFRNNCEKSNVASLQNFINNVGCLFKKFYAYEILVTTSITCTPHPWAYFFVYHSTHGIEQFSSSMDET